MTVKEVISRANARTGVITINVNGDCKTFDVREDIPDTIGNLKAVYNNYFVLQARPLRYILYIICEVPRKKTYRLVILSGSNGRQSYPETYEWEAEHLTRSALNHCINRLYSCASLDEYTVYGYLQHIEDGWYLDTIAEIRASTWLQAWPDRISTTSIYINNKYIRTMGRKIRV